MVQCCLAANYFSDWIVPEGWIQRGCLGPFYERHPVMSRVLATPIAFFSGTVKVFFFPVFCAVGILVMPIIAIIRACQGKKDGGEWLKAWCFSIVGLAASIAFIAVACYYLPLIVTCALLVTFLAISIIAHVYKLVKEPAL
jgi:hypothetical protein